MATASERGALWSILEYPAVYEAFHFLIGAKAWRRRFVRDVLRIRDGHRVLDIGCGPGALREEMPERVHYVGIDRNAEYIDRARRKFRDRGQFVCCDVSNIEWNEQGSFDVVFAVGLLHHLDDDTALRLLSDVAAKASGARVIFVDPCYDPRQSALQRFVVTMDRGKHIRSFDDGTALFRNAFPNSEARFEAGYLPFPITHCIVAGSP